MAFGKHYRHEKQASSFCFKGTVVIILGLCVLAVWMMNSSSPVPAERKSFSTVIKPKTETKEKANDSVTFEDNPGDLPDDAIKGDDGDPEKRPEIEQKSEHHKTSDGNEEKISDENEEKQSGNEEKTPDENDENTSVRDEQNSEEGANSNEGKPIERSENDNDKVIVNEDNEKLTETGDNEAGSQEEDAQNNSQSGKDGGSGGGGNEESEVREDGEKNEGEAGNDRKQEPGIEEKVQDPKLSESLPNGGQFELLKENTVEPGKWGTQDAESRDEKEREEIDAVPDSKDEKESSESQGQIAEEPSSFNESGKQLEDKEKSLKESKKKNKEQFNENIGYPVNWQLCNVTAGADYIPCLDNEEAIRKLRSTKHYEHRERHCPKGPLTCLVPLPKGYRWPIHWPESRDKIWYNNVPHTKLAIVKGHQNWVKVSGEYLTFPGGGTQFKNGALHYIDFIEETIPDVAWGKHSRVILDVGCGVASFGGFLFEREVLTMSFAPKDEHEAQIQLALERRIPAISAVMGTQRLPFPSAVFDIVHCARCRVPWHADGGKLLLELNRLLRPGGYFVWSATPIYQNLEVDVAIWEAMSSLTTSICWNLLAKKVDPVNEIGVAIYQKPTSNICYESRRQNEPPLCEEGDDPNAAWYVPMNSCLHRVPTGDDEHGTEWPEEWPQRLEQVPSWLDNNLHAGFMSDTKHWKHIVDKSYLTGLGIDWSAVRNVMDMKAAYGGFAAALASQPVWVMNVVPTDAPSTLPVIYERGLFGIYHDWCESFNTYPRTYDLLHADHLFSGLQQRCTLVSVMTEVDRILRPGGSIIFRDKVETLNELEALVKSLHWQIRMTFSQQQEGIICAQKTMWRPQTVS